jgi:transmembrane sensor
MPTSSDKAEILSLLKKYRAGECTPEETARIREWFDSFEELPDDPAFQIAADQAAIAALAKLFPEQATEKKGRTIMMRLLQAAAVLVLVCTAALFAFKYTRRAKVAVTYALLQANKGERKKITLPDGTVVTINANTQLRIPSDFNTAQRNIFLSGEAVFDVASDVSKPFVVHSGNLQTTVLGTSFNVKAYPGEKDVQIAVLSGKVKIEKDKDVLTSGLIANQVLTYNTEDDSLVIGNGKSNEIAAWQNNSFYFEQASVEEIATVLERQYNTSITIVGKAKHNCRYTLQLKNETIKNALELLAQLSGITYEISHNEIKINVTSCE